MIALVIVAGVVLVVAIITGLLTILTYVHDIATMIDYQNRQVAQLKGNINDLVEALTLED